MTTLTTLTTWTTPTQPPPTNTARTSRDEVDPLVRTRPRVSASPIARPRVAFADSARTDPHPRATADRAASPRGRRGGHQRRSRRGWRSRASARARSRTTGPTRATPTPTTRPIPITITITIRGRRRRRGAVSGTAPTESRCGPRSSRSSPCMSFTRGARGRGRRARTSRRHITRMRSESESEDSASDSSSPFATGSRGGSPRSRWSRATC